MTTEPGHGMAGRTRSDVLLEQDFEERDLRALRRSVAAHAARTPLDADQVNDLVLVVSELASNTILHGGGAGRIQLWTTPEGIWCRVSDQGPGIPNGLPPRRPEPTATRGRGLWLVLKHADTVTVDAGPGGGGAVVTVTLRFPGE
jgi:anti-sigma regulatory factor (Ser/Thr protein kinase)